jgi:hypothetical protein
VPANVSVWWKSGHTAETPLQPSLTRSGPSGKPVTQVPESVGGERGELSRRRFGLVATRTEAAMIGGVGLQIIRDWVLHFNERGPDGLLNGKSPGQPSKL